MTPPPRVMGPPVLSEKTPVGNRRREGKGYDEFVGHPSTDSVVSTSDTSLSLRTGKECSD